MTENIFNKGPSSLERTERELKKMENELYKESHDVVFSAVAHTFDIDPEDGELPAEWLAELEHCTDEEERASKLRELNRRKRIATYALLPPKEAPVALQIAAKVLGGMHKARAMEGSAPRELNLTLVSFSAPEQQPPMFPVKEIKHE
jgi:hypothetical protein